MQRWQTMGTFIFRQVLNVLSGLFIKKNHPIIMAEVENIHDFRNEKALRAQESQSFICDAAEC